MCHQSRFKKVSVFEYTNYRTYLLDLYAELKATKPQFSFRYFSRMAGFSSPNFLKLVMEGQRNLSADSIEKFSKALKLNREEAGFFRGLVLFCQAQTTEDKKVFGDQILRSKFFKKMNPIQAAQFTYFSHWYCVPIRELVDLPSFREDPAWIAQTLKPAISPSEAASALAVLLELGMVKRSENGKLVQSNSIVSTGDEVTSSLVAQFHREMIQKGSESLDRFSSQTRDISGLTLGLSSTGMKKVKELIQRARKDILAVAHEDKELNSVYQVNIQFFPLAEIDENPGEA